ncbi:MAG: hypothetical protein JWN15_2577 [Firmicutes bacterium]|nr:hypothetical protein [Bacillota bacterium]
MADQYPKSVSICVRDAAMLEDLRTVNIRHRDLLRVSITEEQEKLIHVETSTAPRRAELGAVVAPIQRLPVLQRAAALGAAGLTVEQFMATVLELDGLNGAISVVKLRIRRLEAERQDMTDLVRA